MNATLVKSIALLPMPSLRDPNRHAAVPSPRSKPLSTGLTQCILERIGICSTFNRKSIDEQRMINGLRPASSPHHRLASKKLKEIFPPPKSMVLGAAW